MGELGEGSPAGEDAPDADTAPPGASAPAPEAYVPAAQDCHGVQFDVRVIAEGAPHPDSGLYTVTDDSLQQGAERGWIMFLGVLRPAERPTEQSRHLCGYQVCDCMAPAGYHATAVCSAAQLYCKHAQSCHCGAMPCCSSRPAVLCPPFYMGG